MSWALEENMKNVRQIEYYRLWPGNGGDSGTWDTDFVEIPASTPEDEVDEAATRAIARVPWTDEVPIATGIYHVPALDETD